jgi:hypothetical protein
MLKNNDPLAIVDRFLSYEIPVVVIGGHAVNQHGFARATEDVDLVFIRSERSEERIANLFAEINAFYIGEETDPATGIEKVFPADAHYIRGRRLMMVGSDLGYLDLFDFLPGLPKESIEPVFETAVVFQGRPFVSLPWLRRLKLAAGRPQDLRDLSQLPQS